MAEYDSWNVSYHDVSLAITPKTVPLADHGTARRNRMNLFDFCWRNLGFDARKAYRRNAEHRD